MALLPLAGQSRWPELPVRRSGLIVGGISIRFIATVKGFRYREEISRSLDHP